MFPDVLGGFREILAMALECCMERGCSQMQLEALHQVGRYSKMLRPRFQDFAACTSHCKTSGAGVSLRTYHYHHKNFNCLRIFTNFNFMNIFKGSINSTNLDLLFEIPALPGRQRSGYWAEFNQRHHHTLPVCQPATAALKIPSLYLAIHYVQYTTESFLTVLKKMQSHH